MKQLYVADLREHRFLVNETNRPGTITNISGSVLSMLPGFHKKQNSTTHNPNKTEEQTSATPETSTIDTASTINNKNAVNNNGKTEKKGNDIHCNTIETISENEVFLNTKNIRDQKDNNSDIADFHVSLIPQNETQNSELSPIHTETKLRMHCAHNKMLNPYNCFVVGSFKEIFQGVDTNNLPTVLQALKELNFILANRAPGLSAHYGFPLEPYQISTKKYQTLSAHTSADLPPIPWTTATEEGHEPKATTNTDLQGNNHQYLDIATMIELGTHTDQIHTLTIKDYVMKKGLLINLDIVTETGVTHTCHQNPNTSIAK